MKDEPAKGRRAILRWIAVVPALALAGAARAEDGKARKVDMKYQDQPMEGQRCADCIHFQPGASAKAPGKCQVVEGDISPRGWCIEYQKKG